MSSGLIKGYLNRVLPKGTDVSTLKKNEGKIISKNGQKLVVYKDEKGKLHAVSAVCTHIGCVVGWNNNEKTWDCPCHGSRFSKDGKVITRPAQKNLEEKEI